MVAAGWPTVPGAGGFYRRGVRVGPGGQSPPNPVESDRWRPNSVESGRIGRKLRPGSNPPKVGEASHLGRKSSALPRFQVDLSGPASLSFPNANDSWISDFLAGEKRGFWPHSFG